MIEILNDSNLFLRKTSKRVTHVDDEMHDLIAEMYDAMVAKNGIGLAAIQVGKAKRFFIYEIPERRILEDTENPESGETDNSPGPCDSPGTETDEDVEVECVYSGEYTVCINPRIIAKEGTIIDDEGCLSREGWLAKVERALKITFQAYDLDMKKFERVVTGLEARCIQHEIDHLDGILFTDRAKEGTLRLASDDEESEEEQTSSISGESTGGDDSVF
jgi:peptide deformylase